MMAGHSVLRRCAEPLLNVARPASACRRAAADVRAERPQPPQNWTSLPPVARGYIAIVTGLGAASIMLALQEINERDAPLLTALAVLSLITAFAKTTLSVPGSASTLSFCYVIDFTALLVLGPAAATLTSAVGVWAQGTFRARRRGPRYRTWFSIGALALTVRAAWLTYLILGGRTGELIMMSTLPMLAATAIVYFLSNTMLVAGAVASTTGRGTLVVWRSTFSAIWPGHLFGFSVATAASAGLVRSKLWLLPFTVAILALTYDTLHAYVEGLSESLIDPMTDLPNLRYLRTHAAQEVERARREETALAVMMIDVVGFKTINDTYGHRAGDLALREVAQRLQSSVRSYDICARYAGDEFVVLLPGCEPGEAQARAEALRAAVAGACFEPLAGAPVRLDVSVGLAMFPAQGDDFEELLAVADGAMFDDKRSNGGDTGGGIDRSAGSAPRKARRLAVNRGLAPAV